MDIEEDQKIVYKGISKTEVEFLINNKKQ